MGEHKYSVLDVIEANETTTTTSITDPLLATTTDHHQREPTIEVVTATPVMIDNDMEEIPNLITTNSVDGNTHDNPKLAASVATGLLGCLLGGPLIGLACGFGAAYAHDRPGAVGDASRAIGDVALLAKGRAQEVNRQHRVVDTTKAAAERVLQQAQEYDREHCVVQKAQNIFVKAWNWTVAFVHRHNLIERGVQNVGKSVVWAAETITAKLNAMADEQQDRAQQAEARPVSEERVKE